MNALQFWWWRELQTRAVTCPEEHLDAVMLLDRLSYLEFPEILRCARRILDTICTLLGWIAVATTPAAFVREPCGLCELGECECMEMDRDLDLCREVRADKPGCLR